MFLEHLACPEPHVALTPNQADEPIPADELARRLVDDDGLICASGDRIDAAVIAAAAGCASSRRSRSAPTASISQRAASS